MPNLLDLVQAFPDGGMAELARRLNWNYRRAQRVFHAENRTCPTKDLELLHRMLLKRQSGYDSTTLEELVQAWREQRVVWVRKELRAAKKALVTS